LAAHLNQTLFADLVRKANFAAPDSVLAFTCVISLGVGFALGRLTAVSSRTFGVVESTLFFELAVLERATFFIGFFSISELKAMSFFELPLANLSLFELICNEGRVKETLRPRNVLREKPRSLA
jgi:hypothetical protein